MVGGALPLLALRTSIVSSCVLGMLLAGPDAVRLVYAAICAVDFNHCYRFLDYVWLRSQFGMEQDRESVCRYLCTH